MVTVVSTVPHSSVVKEAVCKNCGATLEYVPADIRNRIESDYGAVYFIVCPPCEYHVIVKDRMLKR
jgi:RNase P subunit RPR2